MVSMGILFGLVAAIGWGTGDFLARYAALRIGSYSTLFFIQFVGIISLTIYLLASGELYALLTSTTWQPWAWAVLAVLCNVFSSFVLYKAFEVGILTLVSPIAASYAAVTVILSVLSGETLTDMHVVGIALVLGGVIIVSTPAIKFSRRSREASVILSRGSLQGVVLALSAALGYGVTFWLLGFHVTPQLGSITPVWLVRIMTPCLLTLCAPLMKQKIQLPPGKIWWFILGTGLFDTAGYIGYTSGMAGGQIAVVTIISSLYSAVTILLAWIVLREELQKNQWLGIGVVFLGIILVNF